jgi:hypothetical protein
MAILNGKPVKAFIYQDHQAHIAVHQGAMQDPKMAAIIGQNPQAQVMMAAAMAHISEHVAFEYRKQIEEQLGIPLPKMDEEMSPEIELEMSRLMAAAAAKLTQKNQAEAQQQQAQQAAQDPVIQMQQQELQLKAKEVDIKEKKLSIDAASKADQLEVEKLRIESQKEIAGMQIGAKSAKDRMDNETKQQMEGVRIGADVAKNQAQMANQARQAFNQKHKPTKGE